MNRSPVHIKVMKTIMLILGVLLQCIVLSASSPTLVRPGNTAVLSCEGAKEQTELFKIKWLKHDLHTDQYIQLVEWVPDIIAPTVMVKEENKIRFNKEDFSLVINSANTSDSGEYTCRGETKPTSDSSPRIVIEKSSELKVSLNDQPNAPEEAPEVIVRDSESLAVNWVSSVIEDTKPVDRYLVFVRIQGSPWSQAHPHPVSAGVNHTVILGLWPYTEYQVSVVAVNDAGQSNSSTPSEWVRTDEAVPDGKPKIDQLTDYSDAIYIEFSPPNESKLNGKLAGYVVAIKKLDCRDSVDANCEKDQVLGLNTTAHNFTNLTPDSRYMISIRVYNNAGDGLPLDVVIKTGEGVPSKPRIISTSVSDYVEVRWEEPAEPNGVILRYLVYWTKEVDGILGKPESANISMEKARGRDGMMSYKIKGLDPYCRYNVEIAAETSKGIGEKSEIPVWTDVAPPSTPTIINATSNSSTSILMEWTRPEVYYRQIDMYRVRHRALDSPLATEITVLRSDMMKDVQVFTINDLRPTSQYEIQVAASSKSIHSDKYFWGNYSKVVSVQMAGAPGRQGENDSNKAGIIAGLVCTTLILIVAALAFLVMRVYVQRRYTFIADPDNGQSTAILNLPESYACNKKAPSSKNSEEVEREAIAKESFANHVALLHADGDLGFSQEYEDINRSTRMDLTATHSADPENKHKNRYINIVAYDHNRVLLKVIPGKPRQTDYINANYVDGYHKSKAYIAAQGPLPATFTDFWRMIWEQNSTVIVMITNLTERGRRKCDQYWPNEGEHLYGCMCVKLLNTYTMAHYTVRMFSLKNVKLKKKSGERVVYQYHYTDWPDHGVPDFTLPTLTFIRKSTAASLSESGPIIVHCSAGVGRTGTYIVIDSMIRQVKDKGTINIYSFLSHIRNQRNYLVQTEDQYIFTHDAMLEFLDSGETEVKDCNLSQYLEELVNEGKPGTSLLSKHYTLVTNFSPKDYQLSSALLEVNKDKNRSSDLLPVELSRVRLPIRPGVDGSDYINASFLHGYNKNEEFIVTQHPMAATGEDFWRMVWDQNSMTIVLLSQIKSQEYSAFWPGKEETVEYGNFKVTFVDDNHQLNHVARDFILQSTQDDYECTTRMISTSYWPESCSPLNTVFELIQTVKQWHHQHEEVEGPIIVVDKFGGTSAATFCALMTLFDQMHHEACVDIYYVAKLYHMKRPGIWPKKEDYHFLYKAIESLCEEASIPGERDSGIGNCSNYPASLPPALTHSNSRHSAIKQETTTM